MPDRNSLLLPSPAQCAPDAAAALLPGPDVAAVCASGLRRGLLLPVDLVALRESWRAEARAGARPAPRPRRLVHDRHTRGLLHAGSMRARAGACTGTEQGADAAAPGPGFPPAVDDRQATQHVSQVSLHSLWCFARAREDASCKAKLRLVQQGCQAPGLHQAEHRHEAARFQCPIICDMQASPGAPPCSPAPDQAAGSPRQCEDCAAAGDPPSSGGAALGAAGSQAASPQDTCMDPGTFAPPSHGAPGRTPVHCCLTMATMLTRAPAQQPHRQPRSRALQTARAATHAALCIATRMTLRPSRPGQRRTQGLRAQKSVAKKVGRHANCHTAGACAPSLESSCSARLARRARQHPEARTRGALRAGTQGARPPRPCATPLGRLTAMHNSADAKALSEQARLSGAGAPRRRSWRRGGRRGPAWRCCRRWSGRTCAPARASRPCATRASRPASRPRRPACRRARPARAHAAAALHRRPARVSRGALGAALLLRRAEHHPAAQHLGGQGAGWRRADAPGGARRAPRCHRPHMSSPFMQGQAAYTSVHATELFATIALCVWFGSVCERCLDHACSR